ncbi:MAG: hypothetical protein LBJ07_03440, partial [Actinomycetes bacterium]|nr:hypothetical protein [Actinomycetes bacterium]
MGVQKMPFRKLAVNSLRTFAIQGIVLVIALPFVAISLSTMFPVALVGPIVYVFLGYKFLYPLPKYNWLSVMSLLIFFGLLFGVYYIVGPIPGNDEGFFTGINSPTGLVLLFNYQATMLVITVVAYFDAFLNFLAGNSSFIPKDFFGNDLPFMTY